MSRNVLLLSILGALLVTAGWYMLLVRPIQDRIVETETEIEAESDKEFRLTSQRAARQKIEDNMLSYLAAIAEIARSIPATAQTATLIDELSSLATETGVGWESGSYGNPTAVEGEGYLEIAVDVTIRGQFFEVLGYLYGIADLDRLIRIDSISISPSQDEDGFTILVVAISAKAFTSADLVIPIVEGEDLPPDEEPAPDEDAEAAAPSPVGAS